MYPLILSLTLAVSLMGGLANAQSQELILQTPADVSTCVPVTLEWSGGVEPYTLIAAPIVLTPLNIIRLYLNLTGQSFQWIPPFYPESFVLLALNDSAGAFARSDTILVTGSDDLTCLGTKQTTTSSSTEATSAAPSSDAILSGGSREHGLSGGAIAGIVIGSVVAALALAFLAMRVKKKRLQTARRRHRATRSDWQPMADMPYPGKYAFSGANAQMENGTGFPTPPSPTVKRPSEAEGLGGIAPRRAVTGESPNSPF
ncbi:hypothetical protein BC628DRAFT_1333214 [Trametes gibbosa]|nr:hypothetical protein BC628DRAFT_1333214 [Trametes gibbosa]